VRKKNEKKKKANTAAKYNGMPLPITMGDHKKYLEDNKIR